jgi:hypothetical protein
MEVEPEKLSLPGKVGVVLFLLDYIPSEIKIE